MKPNQLLFTCLLVLSAGLLAAQSPVPDVVAKTLSGESVNLRQAYGQAGDKITVFSFWATWCSPCKKELDAISDYYEEWQEKYNVEIVAITIDDQRAIAKVPGLVAAQGWEYTILAGTEQDMRNAFNFTAIPQTYVVGKDGMIVYNHSGYVPGDENELEELLISLATGAPKE